MANTGFDFFKKMKIKLGPEFESFEKSLASKPELSIRLNPKKNTVNTFSTVKVPWSTEGYYIAERPLFTLDPIFHGGGYYVQEPSSMVLGFVLQHLISNNNYPIVLDLCAAPGGKSTHILSTLNGNGYLVSNEVIKSRVRILRENLMKWGYANYCLCNNDPEAFSKSGIRFDCILVDAPCSGEGMIRKDDSILDQWKEELVEFCALRQKRIVGSIINCLNENGYLIYSTCTYSDQENIQNCAWITENFELNSVEIDFPTSWNISIVKNGAAIGYQFYPHKLQGEGFFISVFQNQHSETTIQRKLKEKNALKKLPQKLWNRVTPYLEHPEEFNFYCHENGDITAVDKTVPIFLYQQEHINIKGFGITMGKLKNEIFIPSHALALSHNISSKIERIELNLEEAKLYLKGLSPFQTMKAKGWFLVCYQDLPLGWIKSLEKRINNYYPKELRIRMSLNT